MTQPKFYELKEGETLGKKKTKAEKVNKTMSLADRLENDDSVGGEVLSHSKHGHQMTFKAKKTGRQLRPWPTQNYTEKNALVSAGQPAT